jgi:transcription-repair coupling factor (superfamily II helicase)
MEILLEKIRALLQYQQLLKQIQENGKQIPGLGLPRAARLPVLAALRKDLNRPILLVTDRADHALALFDELSFWVQSPRYHFSEPNPLFYEQAAWGVTTRRERLHTLTALAAYHLPFAQKPEESPIFVTSARSLMTRTLPRRDFLKACKRLSVGQTAQPDAILRHLAEIGFQRVNTVLEPGQFSRRGGLLDLWTPAEKLPARLDFFGDEIETIRKFDPASQRTIENLDSILITPAREFIARDLGNELGKFEADTDNPITDIELSEFHIPLLHTQPASLLDYLPQKTLVLVDDLSVMESMVEEVEEQAVKFRNESIQEGTLPADFPLPYITLPDLLDSIQSRSFLELGYSTRDESEDLENSLSASFSHDERFGGRLKSFIEYLVSIVERGEQALVISRQSPRLYDLWLEADHPAEADNPQFIEASLSEGFMLQSQRSDSPALDNQVSSNSYSIIHLITDSEIFGWERPQPRTRQRPVAETPESVYADLQMGDYVVHIDHGVGRFGGLVQRELDGHVREFLAVEYDSGGQLYVPVHQADRLTRYIGAEGTKR